MLAFAQTTATTPNQAATTTANQTAGTISLTQAAKDFLNDNLNATMIDAASAAEDQVPNGATVAAHFGILQGSLVYNVTVADTDTGNAFNVFVDAASGKILSKSAAFPVDTLGLPAGFDNATKTLIDAADVAENQVQNGMVVAGSIATAAQAEGGALVYLITVADIDNGTLHETRVNPTTGSIISSEVVPLGELHIGDLF
ncbi:PepSY domain-containing protein [Candidatus Nitrososphaera evergladensis]|nr:PepSY domain-containing protein [Candidatus Nitrososphaera evergladensis]